MFHKIHTHTLLPTHPPSHIFSSGFTEETVTCFAWRIAILKCFFFILSPRLVVGAFADWHQAISRHYFSVFGFLHCLIQFLIFHIINFSTMCCYLHFLADFCWSASSSKLNQLTFLLKGRQKCVTACTAHVPKSNEKYVLQRLIRMRTLS